MEKETKKECKHENHSRCDIRGEEVCYDCGETVWVEISWQDSFYYENGYYPE